MAKKCCSEEHEEKKDNTKVIIAIVIVVCLVAGFLLGLLATETIFDDEDGPGLGFITKDPYDVDIVPADFVTGVNHTYFPMAVGNRWVYESDTEDGLERIEVEVLNETRTVLGVECTVVRDTEYLDGELVEDTWDWYAQDKYGNVWYMGEDTAEYENGKVVSTHGAWDPDKDGSLPGIYMWANPIPGTTYRQEYLKGEAEDFGTVYSLGNTVTIGIGTYTDVLKTKDWMPSEPDAKEFKYYAPGVGVIMEEGDDERVELVEFTPA